MKDPAVLLEEIRQHTATAALLAEAGPVQLQLADSLHGGNFADGEFCGNRIRILKNISHERQRAALVFELTNVIQMYEHDEVNVNLRNQKYLSCEDYTKAKELVEYKGVQRHIAVMREVQWNDDLVRKSSEILKGFDHYYENVLYEDHKDYYRKIWHERHRTPCMGCKLRYSWNLTLSMASVVTIATIAMIIVLRRK